MSTPDFTKMVPGFDFLQGLLKGAGSGLPNMSQWIAPTLDAEEVDKRIQELRTVQFWLEQNAKMLGATIQALEVQRMTLATIKSLNVPMADLGQAMKLDPQAYMPKSAPAAPPASDPPAAPKPARAARKPAAATKAKPAPSPASSPVDPMQWWGALTQQFTELAARAVKDTPVEAMAQQAASAAAAVTEPVRKAAAAAKPARARRR